MTPADAPANTSAPVTGAGPTTLSVDKEAASA